MRPSTTVAATTSSGPSRWCQLAAFMKTDMTSRVGVFLSRRYSGRNRLGAPVERTRRPAEGAPFGRGRTECEEQIAMTVEPEKKSVKASGSAASQSGRHLSGRPPGRPMEAHWRGCKKRGRPGRNVRAGDKQGPQGQRTREGRHGGCEGKCLMWRGRGGVASSSRWRRWVGRRVLWGRGGAARRRRGTADVSGASSTAPGSSATRGEWRHCRERGGR